MSPPPQCLAVLVVEDDDDIREAVAGVLEGEGFQVYQAENGARALDRLKDMPHPSLILADLMMPVMDGWQLIGALSRDDRLATLPVVLVSALDKGRPEGFLHIKKPIDFNDLLKIVDGHCLRRT
ncbi:MAG TPA: response regulator [Polyangiaceae bacterium]|nr:response regulator [Polyangiaceae bacterium]